MYKCNLTNKKINIAVRDKEGYLYDSFEIINWLSKSSFHPFLDKTMNYYDLEIDKDLQKAINDDNKRK